MTWEKRSQSISPGFQVWIYGANPSSRALAGESVLHRSHQGRPEYSFLSITPEMFVFTRNMLQQYWQTSMLKKKMSAGRACKAG